MSVELSDRELERLSSLCLGLEAGVLADDLRLSREVEAALRRLFDLYEKVAPRRSEPAERRARALLPATLLAGGELLRLWQPLAPLEAAGRDENGAATPALSRCRALWKDLSRVARELEAARPDHAERHLRAMLAPLAELREAAYRVGRDWYVGDALAAHRRGRGVFAAQGLRCQGCVVAPRHRIDDAAACHPFDCERLLEELSAPRL